MSESNIDNPSLRDRIFLWLAGIFVVSLLVADITGGKFFYFGEINLFGYAFRLEHSVGMVSFPVTFVLTDLLNEFYGKRAARRVTYLGLGMAAYAFTLILIGRMMPPAPADRTYIPEEMFQRVFGMSNRLYVASLSAFLLGQLTDIYLFTVLKRWTGGKLLWLRATGSTIFSQAIDSLTVSFVLGFGATLANGEKTTMKQILVTAATGYALKFFIAIGVTPLIYAMHHMMKIWAGMTPKRIEPTGDISGK